MSSAAIPLLISLIAADYAQIELARFENKGRAIDAAKRASVKLHLPIDRGTLSTPPKARVHGGEVITVHEPVAGTFVVASFLGDASEAKEVLPRARRFAKTAKIEVVSLDEAQLDEFYRAFSETSVLILGSHPKYEEALASAKAISEKLKLTHSTRGMIYDKKRGLIWPDDFEDEIYAGSYYGRRYNECSDAEHDCISVERSDFYSGFTKGFYIIVGGLYGSEEADKKLAKARAVVPDAYVKKTSIYLGCIH
jgi:hypothetical protein